MEEDLPCGHPPLSRGERSPRSIRPLTRQQQRQLRLAVQQRRGGGSADTAKEEAVRSTSAFPSLSLSSALAPSRPLPISAVSDIPTSTTAPPATHVRVRWGHRTTDGDKADASRSTKADDEADKESLALPSVALLPTFPPSTSSSPPPPPTFPVLHSVVSRARGGPRPSISKRSREVAFTSADFSSHRSSLSQPPHPPPRRASTAEPNSRQAALKPRPPFLAFSLFQDVRVRPVEPARELGVSGEATPAASSVASPHCPPCTSPDLSPQRGPALDGTQPSPTPPPLTPSLVQASPAWVDFVHWRALSPLDSSKAARLVSTLHLAPRSSILPATKTALLSFIHRYTRDQQLFHSSLLFIQHSYEELTLLTQDDAIPRPIQPLLTFLSFDLLLHLTSRPQPLPPHSSALCTSLFTSLLSIVLTHTWSFDEYFPSAPFHLQRVQLDGRLHQLQAEHAERLEVMRRKAEQHRRECERWQRGVKRVREAWKRGVQAVTLSAWQRQTRMARWRRGSSRDEEGDGAMVQRLHRLRQRLERRVQLRSLLTAWRSSTLVSRVSALRVQHSALLSSVPQMKGHLAKLEATQAELTRSHTLHSLQLDEQRSHLSLMQAQIIDYAVQLREVEGGVEGVRQLLLQWWELLLIAREEVEFRGVQLLCSGYQDMGEMAPNTGGGSLIGGVPGEAGRWGAGEARWKRRSLNAEDDSASLPAAIGLNAGPVGEQSDGVLHRWMEAQMSHARVTTLPPSSAEPMASPTSSSPTSRSTVQARDDLLASLRSRSSLPTSTAYTTRTLLSTHFSEEQSMQQAMQRTEDSTPMLMALARGEGGASEGEQGMAGAALSFPSLTSLLSSLALSDSAGEEDVLLPSTSAHPHSRSRSRVPSSPLVTALAQSMRRGVTFHSFTSTAPLPLPPTPLPPTDPSPPPPPTDPSPDDDPTDGIEGVKEGEKRKKKPSLTIQINPQRTSLSSPAPPPTLPPPPPPPLSPSTSTPSSSSSRPTRFHRSTLRSRNSRSTSLLAGNALGGGGGGTPAQAEAESAGWSGRLVGGGGGGGGERGRFSSTTPLPVATREEKEEDGGGEGEAVLVRGLIVHRGGVIVRPPRRWPLAFYPYVLQGVDGWLTGGGGGDSDAQQAAVLWLLHAFPALPYAVLPFLSFLPSPPPPPPPAHPPVSASQQMREVNEELRLHRRRLGLHQERAMHRQELWSGVVREVERRVVGRVMQRVGQQEREEGVWGGVRAKGVVEDEGYLRLVSAHTSLPSPSIDPSDPSPNSHHLPPHHRSRSSLKSVDTSTSPTPYPAPPPPHRTEPYTRIRSLITSLLHTHGRTRSSLVLSSSTSTTRTSSHHPMGPRAKSASMDYPRGGRSGRMGELGAVTMPLVAAAIPEGGWEEEWDEGGDSAGQEPVQRSFAMDAGGSSGLLGGGAGTGGVEGSGGDVVKCERILGHFHHDLRRIFRHSIDCDMANHLKAAAATEGGGSVLLSSATLGRAADPYTLTGLQFARFIRQYRLPSPTLSPHSIDLLYAGKMVQKQAVYEAVMKRAGSVDTLSFDDFLELLVQVAVLRFRDEEDVSVRLWRLFHEVLEPATADVTADFRLQLSISNVQAVLDKHSLWLQSIYASYATASFTSDSLYQLHDAHSLNLYSINTVDEVCMQREDWDRFMADSTLSPALVPLAALGHIWTAVQQDLAGEDYFGGAACMVYSEWTEALCVLAVYWERSPYVSVESKLDGLLMWLQGVQEMEERRHKHAVIVCT